MTDAKTNTQTEASQRAQQGDRLPCRELARITACVMASLGEWLLTLLRHRKRINNNLL